MQQGGFSFAGQENDARYGIQPLLPAGPVSTRIPLKPMDHPQKLESPEDNAPIEVKVLPQSPRSPRLIGRQTQLKSLDELLRHTLAPRGSVVLVTGEAGIGKSSVVYEAKTRAEARGFRTLEADCFEPDRIVPYGPIFDLFETLLRSTPDPVELLGPKAPILIKWISVLQSALPHIAPAASVEPEQEKRRFFNALTDFFVRLSSNAPLMIVVEDLHWSDDATLDYWLHLARRISREPILLVLTYRRDQVPPSLSHFLSELDRARLATTLLLEPLTREQADEMLRAIFDLLRPVRPEFLDAIYGLTEGNPFFIEEVLESLITSGDIFYNDGAWNRRSVNELHIPRTVSDGVRQRSEQLSPPARDILVLASVLGRRFDFVLLQELSGMGEGTLLNVLKELVQAQLVTEVSADQFAFRHTLIREAIYATQLLRERRGYHLAIAQAIEKRLGEPSPQALSDLAVNYYQAAVWDKALEYSLLAGERAQGIYAPREAVEYYTYAVNAAQQLSVSPSPRLLRARGQAYETLGDFERAAADYEGSCIAARDTQDRTAEWQSLIDLGFLWASRDYTRTEDYYRQALELARASGERRLVAHSFNRIGNWHLNMETPQEARTYHEKALEIFRDMNEPHGVAASLDLGGVASINAGDLFGGKSYCEQAITLFREMDDRVGLASCLATIPMCAGDYSTSTFVPATSFARARAEAEEAFHLAREIGWRSGEAFALTSLAANLSATGEYANALDAAQQALDLATEINHRQWGIRAELTLGLIYLDLLGLTQARQHLQAAAQLASESGSILWTRFVTASLARTDILQDNPVAAAARLGAVLESTAETRAMGERHCWYARAELAHHEKKEHLALEIVERLISTAPNVKSTDLIPPLWKLRGEIWMGLKNFAQAEADLIAAKEVAVRQGARPLLWRIQVALGRVYVARKQYAAAEGAFSAARAITHELVENIPETGLRADFLTSVTTNVPSPRPLTPRQAVKREFAGLTERERQVAAQIAMGRSNREIAEALVLSEYTVATHVGNILNKLGFHSRAQIAAWSAERGLEASAD